MNDSEVRNHRVEIIDYESDCVIHGSCKTCGWIGPHRLTAARARRDAYEHRVEAITAQLLGEVPAPPHICETVRRSEADATPSGDRLLRFYARCRRCDWASPDLLTAEQARGYGSEHTAERARHDEYERAKLAA